MLGCQILENQLKAQSRPTRKRHVREFGTRLNSGRGISKSQDTDPYEVFKRLVARGAIGADFAENWKMMQEELERQVGR
ncbi:MAG: hypothetical protein M1358_04380 [Chloroflexi bacterium]|nr:hypothetical protein [Chloroflexota bacterium]